MPKKARPAAPQEETLYSLAPVRIGHDERTRVTFGMPNGDEIQIYRFLDKPDRLCIRTTIGALVILPLVANEIVIQTDWGEKKR